MLSSLYIKNVAVIAEASLELGSGLNVFTGETGAGKSILISAINALLGERTSKDLVRAGEQKAEISALFTDIAAEARQTILEAGYDFDEDEGLLVQRDITAEGKTTCRIAGRPATVGILKQITPLLITIHGQHDTQQLLSQSYHMHLLDAYGGLLSQRENCSKAYRLYTKTKGELEGLQTDEQQIAQRVDMLQYQIDEILDAELQPEEEEALKSRQKLLTNALEIARCLSDCLSILDGYDDQPGLLTQCYSFNERLQTAGEYLDEAGKIGDSTTDIYYNLEGYGSDLRRMLDAIDTDPESLEQVEQRLNLLYELKRKYGATVADVIAYCEKAEIEMEELDNQEARSAKLQAEMERLLEEVTALAQTLSTLRRDCAERFTQQLESELTYLDMPNVKLSVEITPKHLGAEGIDDVALFVQTNLGEPSKPLAKIASGGELSRIMLSIQNVLADKESVQTMIFDEVDTGVSGRAAQKVGRKLAQVGNNRQVLVVTHLAQVAAFAHNHFYIAKRTEQGRTFTHISSLEPTERVDEIARLIGGEVLTDAARANAKELLELGMS